MYIGTFGTLFFKIIFQGGNTGNLTTIIKNPNGEDLVYKDDSRTITLTVKEWLELAGIDLDSFQDTEVKMIIILK